MGKIRKWINSLQQIISVSTMLLMFVAIGVNILGNWFFRKRYGALEELGTAAYMFSIYAGFNLLYKQGDLTSVTFVVNSMKPKARWLAELIRFLFIFAFSVVVAYFSYKLCMKSFVKKLPALHLPYFYLDISLVAGCGLMAVSSFLDLLNHFKNAKNTMGGESE